MKAKILQHTGLTEKQFYSKYKSPEEFFNSKEGKAFKKAQGGGTFMGAGSIPQQFGSGIPPITNNQIPPLLQYPQPGDSINTSLPTQPDQGEMNDAMSLINPPKKGQLQNEAMGANQQILGQPASPKKSTTATKSLDVMKALPGATGQIAGVVSSRIDEKNKLKDARMWKGVSDLQLQASKTRPEQSERSYVRPEDQTITGEELFPIYGVGTNPIAQDGSMIHPYIQGNPTEIQNTYDPYDIYTDLGYEPLNDSVIKQYQSGGDIAGMIAGPANSAIGSAYDNNAGYQTGAAVGDMVKYIPGVGPVVSAVAGPILGAIGGQLDQTFGPAGKIKKAQAATDRNVQNMAFGQQAASVQAGYASHLEHGGNVNPQVIKYFGNHSMKELLKPDPMMDTLQDGGGLQTHWGGYAEPDSYNPYIGESVMFRGNSHHDSDSKGNTGIGITYGNSPVEVEKGEPAMKLQDGGGENLVVFGNLPINKQNANLLGDPKATNKKFKNYIADLNKQENKHTKTLDKNTKDLNDLQVYDAYDKLAFSSHQANMTGSNMNLKSIADKKQKASFLQNAINETRDELSDHLGYTVSAEQLAKDGKITKDKDPITKNAKYGRSIRKAITGEDINPPVGSKGNVNPYQPYSVIGQMSGALNQNPIGPNNPNPMFKSREAYEEYRKETNKAYDDPEIAKQLVNHFLTYEGPDQEDVRSKMNKQKTFADMVSTARKLATDEQPGPYHINAGQFSKAPIIPATSVPTPIKEEISAIPEKGNWWDLIGAALPYIRPSNAKGLDYNQLLGETYAMSNNQVEPVFAQSYQPQLDVPYDISLQDQLNQVTSQTRAAQRMSGYNPAAQAAIAGQAYEPANRILGEQFRMNQAMKAGVYDRNRATMNQAKMTNLGLYDQQAQRQGQAISNTKAINQAALNSISSKYQQNALENKTLQTYENLYNYRFGPKMRAYNMNAPFNPNIPQVYQEGEDYTSVIPKEPITKETSKTTKKTSRNGSIVQSLKRI